MNDKYAIVAEYKNAAILERAGNVRSAWEGCEYFTDGRTYLFFKTGDADRLGLLSLNNEREAKAFIDHAREHPQENPEPLLTYKEMYQILYKKPHEGDVPVYIFNEQTGFFTFFNGVRDGQHRHKGIK